MCGATSPPQHITNGAVHIRLTEGKVGKLTIDGLHQTSPGYLERRLDLPPGSVVDTPALTDRVRLLDRTSDVQVRIALQPGQEPGLTDVIADAIEPPRDTLQFFYENQGVVTTGQDEVDLYYKRHSLLGIDDRLTFFGTYSAGDLSGNLGYNVPITPYGTRLGLTGGHSAVRIVNGPLGPIHVTGESNSTTLTVTQPAIVTEHWAVIANAGYGWENSLSSVSHVSIQDVDSSTESLGVSISYATDVFAAQISPGINIVQSHDHIPGMTCQRHEGLIRRRSRRPLFGKLHSAAAERPKVTNATFTMRRVRAVLRPTRSFRLPASVFNSGRCAGSALLLLWMVLGPQGDLVSLGSRPCCRAASIGYNRP